MTIPVNELPNFKDAAALGGHNAGRTKRAWPQWKRTMGSSLAAMYRWHPEALVIPVLDFNGNQLMDPQGNAIATPAHLAYAYHTLAWQAGYKLGFESGAGWKRKRKTLTRS